MVIVSYKINKLCQADVKRKDIKKWIQLKNAPNAEMFY